MPKINSVTISFDGDKHVYRPGDWVKGQWKIDVGEAFSVRGVRVALLGAAYTRWPDDNPQNDDKIGYEKFTSQWNTVFGTKLGEKSTGNHTYPAGKHVHKFSFQVPQDRTPSSYEGKYGAIRYWAYLEIDRPLLRFNITRLKVITVLENIDVNAQQYSKRSDRKSDKMTFVGRKTEKKVCKAIMAGDEGIVMLHGQTDRGAYCPGEKMHVSLIAHNQTDRDLGIVKATLMQRVNFFAGGEEKVKDTLLQCIVGATLKKQDRRRWTQNILNVPAVPPTTTDGACRIVKVKYFVKVFVDIPKIHGGDACVLLPVTIGTVPQGQSTSLAEASNSVKIDASSGITNCECTHGCVQFTKGESKFPATSYVPWCTFVPNFKFPETTTATVPNMTTVTNSAPPAGTHTSVPPSPAVPSAPPIDVMPPSYDDVMKEIADAKTEKTTEATSEPDTETEAETSTEATPPMPEKVALSLLLLMFQDKFLEKVRDALVECAESLKACRGHALALAPHLIVGTGTWPARTAVAMFVFPTKKDASDWLEQFNYVIETKNMTLQDVMIMNTHELFQNEKSLFGLNLIYTKDGATTARINDLNVKAARYATPLRVSMGGVIICHTKVISHVTGNWPDSKACLNIVQWDSLKQFWKYSTELKKGKCKECLTQSEELYDARLKTMFQSEDLSFLQEAAGSTIESDDSQTETDDRREQTKSEQ